MPHSDKDKEREAKRQYYLRNREKVRERARELHKEDPEERKFRQAAKLANLRYPGPLLTGKDVRFLVESKNRTCHWCGRENLSGLDLTLEHLRPTNDLENLALACRSCNSSRLHVSNGIRKTDEEKLANQRRLERLYRKRNEELIRLRNIAKYIQNYKKINVRSRKRYEKEGEQIRALINQRYAEDEQYREERKACSKEWRASRTPEQRIDIRTYKHDWYQQQRAQQTQRAREKRANMTPEEKDAMREYKRNWWRQNRDKKKAQQQ